MIVKIPASLEQFCGRIGSGLTAGQRKVLPAILAGILLCGGRRSLAGLGRAVVTERRNRASLSKLLRRDRFRTRDMYDEAAQRMIDAQPVSRGRRLWFLLLDGVATQRGGFTQIENARQFKVSQRTKKGGTPSTKSHTFVMGLVLTDQGVRIPLARRTWRTEEYCRTHKKKYLKQTELAGAQIIEYYELRWQIELWFRELKSHLGLADYGGTDFEAFERYIDLVLLAFLFLEQHRQDLMRTAGSRRRSGELAAMRMTCLQRELAAEAAEGDLAYLSRLLRSAEWRKHVLQLWAQMRKVA